MLGFKVFGLKWVLDLPGQISPYFLSFNSLALEKHKAIILASFYAHNCFENFRRGTVHGGSYR